jgi:hypothetical protein
LTQCVGEFQYVSGVRNNTVESQERIEWACLLKDETVSGCEGIDKIRRYLLVELYDQQIAEDDRQVAISDAGKRADTLEERWLGAV